MLQAGGRRLLQDKKEGKKDDGKKDAGKKEDAKKGEAKKEAKKEEPATPGSEKLYMVVGFEVVACSIRREAGEEIKRIACPASATAPNAPLAQEVKTGEAGRGGRSARASTLRAPPPARVRPAH